MAHTHWKGKYLFLYLLYMYFVVIESPDKGYLFKKPVFISNSSHISMCGRNLKQT